MALKSHNSKAQALSRISLCPLSTTPFKQIQSSSFSAPCPTTPEAPSGLVASLPGYHVPLLLSVPQFPDPVTLLLYSQDKSRINSTCLSSLLLLQATLRKKHTDCCHWKRIVAHLSWASVSPIDPIICLWPTLFVPLAQ